MATVSVEVQENAIKLAESTVPECTIIHQDETVSSSNEANQCESSANCGNCSGSTTKLSVISECGSQTEIETGDASVPPAMARQLDVLQSKVDQMLLKLIDVVTIASTVHDVKNSMTFMLRKIDDLSNKLESMSLSDHVTQANGHEDVRLSKDTSYVNVVRDHCPDTEVSESKADAENVALIDAKISEEKDKTPCPEELIASSSEFTPAALREMSVIADSYKSVVSSCPPNIEVVSKQPSILSNQPVVNSKPMVSGSTPNEEVVVMQPSALPNSSVGLNKCKPAAVAACPPNVAVVKLPPPKNPEELNKRLIPPLKKVIELKVKYNEAEAKQNMKIMMDTVKSIIDAMKATNPLFKDLFHRTGYTGSYYDGLRISEASEFDLNLVMRLPFSQEDIELEASSEPAFFRYHLKRELEVILGTHLKWTKDLYQILLSFFEDRYFLRDKWQNWCHKVITKAWGQIVKPEGVRDIVPYAGQYGPAITVKILLLSSSKSIDVDLVPVLDCAQYPMPSELHRSERFNKLSPEAQGWFLVPKRLKGDKFTLREVKQCWRISFPEAEKALLDCLSCVKPLIKLFKLLRDVENWPIASYFIKSLFLLELDEHCELEWWQEKNMGFRFIQMLEKFQLAMKIPFIPYYFNQDANLSVMAENTATPISNRLGRLKTRLSANPEEIVNVFKAVAKKNKVAS